MDPISALSVASSVITFVDFAAKFISSTTVIFNSADGTSAENLRLENVYSKLQAFSTRLQASANPVPSLAGHESDNFQALQQLAVVCGEDCQALIDVINRMKVRKKDGRSWRSVLAAFKDQLGRSEILDIESRLARTQRVMSLHVSSIISQQIHNLTKTVDALKKSSEMIGQTSTIDSMTEDLAHLELESNCADSARTHPVFTVTQVEGFLEKLSSLIRSQESLQTEAVLASLNYDVRPARHSAITDAHKNTFEWAFASHLSDWLRSGSGIFWISGKAGSGKSTFMKFLADHSQTRELLAEWTSSEDVWIGTHYFWSVGTTMQRSQQGLLRSLLFDMFRSNPDIIRIVCPGRWAEAKPGASMGLSRPWTLTELLGCLRISASMKDLTRKACLFIDGLDEYEGDLIELCNVLRDLSASPSIKVCASSRPWVQFEDGFGANETRKLYMHDLTRADIEKFTKDRLESHPRWTFDHTELDESNKNELIEQVAERAEGVFLWAFLVTQSLREGLSHDDTIADMRKRLDSLPRDLETLFKRMLESVDAIYHSKMAGTVQVAIHAFHPLSIDVYWHLEKELEERDYVLHHPIDILSPSRHDRQRERARRRINARTKGLLETRNGIVEFLHRTVRDFFLTKEMSDYLRPKLDHDFNTFYLIAKAHLALLRSLSFERHHFDLIFRKPPMQTSGLFIAWLNQGLLYATEAVTTLSLGSDDGMRLLDEYERSIVEVLDSPEITIDGTQYRDPRAVFREEVVKHRLSAYVEQKFHRDPGYFNVFEKSPLFAALTPMEIKSGSPPCPSPDIVRMLLGRRYDPNTVWTDSESEDNYTPWTCFAHDYFVSFGWSEGFCNVVETGIVTMLLEFGADPNAYEGLFQDFCFTALGHARHGYTESILNTLDAFLDRLPRPDTKYRLPDIAQWLSDSDHQASEDGDEIARVLERFVGYMLKYDKDVQPIVFALQNRYFPGTEKNIRHIIDMVEQATAETGPAKKRKSASAGALEEDQNEGEEAASENRTKRRK